MHLATAMIRSPHRTASNRSSCRRCSRSRSNSRPLSACMYVCVCSCMYVRLCLCLCVCLVPALALAHPATSGHCPHVSTKGDKRHRHSDGGCEGERATVCTCMCTVTVMHGNGYAYMCPQVLASVCTRICELTVMHTSVHRYYPSLTNALGIPLTRNAKTSVAASLGLKAPPTPAQETLLRQIALAVC